jgi:hypothetical protein
MYSKVAMIFLKKLGTLSFSIKYSLELETWIKFKSFSFKEAKSCVQDVVIFSPTKNEG